MSLFIITHLLYNTLYNHPFCSLKAAEVPFQIQFPQFFSTVTSYVLSTMANALK